MANVTIRRLRILQLLPYKKDGGITVARLIELLTLYGIDSKTRDIQRDMAELSCGCEGFQIRCDDTNKPHRWYWDSDTALSIPAMSQYTALTLQLAEKTLKPMLPVQILDHLNPSFSAAGSVLNDNNKRQARSWLKKIRVVPRSIHQISASIPDGLYDTLTKALYEDKQLKITYTSASNTTGIPKEHTIHPYALLFRGPIIELIGKKVGKADPMRLLLHRMHTAEMLTTRSIIPTDFDLDSFIKSKLAKPYEGEAISLKVWIREDAKAHVIETPFSEDQIVEPTNDGFIVAATVRMTIELKWWLLGLGERIEVLEPESLRTDIKDTVVKAAKRYQ